jgi:hypothetical protein
MFDADVSPQLVIALEMILVGMSIALLRQRFRRYRFLLRQLPAGFGPAFQGPFLLIYFTNATSVLCSTVQRPAIERLRDMLGGDLQVFIIDTHEEPELASLCGVWRVPATLLISPHGELSHINHGVVRAEKLLMQMHDIEIEN